MLPSGVRETYFCPQDADLADKQSLLKISEVIQLMNSAAAGRKLLLIDSCREQVLSKEGQKKSARRIELGSVHENRRSVPGGMAVLFSCSSNQFSWEHEPLGHSVFSYHVIQYLNSKADTLFYDSGNLDLNGLVFYVSKRTNDYVFGKNLDSDGQLPVLRGSSSNWRLGKFRPESFTNSVGATMRLIPAGEFMMGSKLSAEEIVREFGDDARPIGNTEHPQRRVTIGKSFYMGATEVTVGQFRKFVADTGYQTEAERKNEKAAGEDSSNESPRLSYSWRNPGWTPTDAHPVVSISWNDAAEFCAWLSRKEGCSYKLPTEAQWEYACRAGTKTLFFSGDDPETLAGRENVADKMLTSDEDTRRILKEVIPHAIKASDGRQLIAPVGTYRPNTFGMHDMHGNVCEWCSDWIVSSRSGMRVFRGGSFIHPIHLGRSACRRASAPSHHAVYIGFRVVSVIE